MRRFGQRGRRLVAIRLRNAVRALERDMRAQIFAALVGGPIVPYTDEGHAVLCAAIQRAWDRAHPIAIAARVVSWSDIMES